MNDVREGGQTEDEEQFTMMQGQGSNAEKLEAGFTMMEVALHKRNQAVRAFNSTVDLLFLCTRTGIDTSQVSGFFKAMVASMYNGDHDGVLNHQAYIFEVLRPQFPEIKRRRITGMMGISTGVTTPSTDPANPEMGQRVERFHIDEIFVVYNDGRLIYHTGVQTYEAAPNPASIERDDDIMSSMLVAIQHFIRDSMGEGAPLGSFEYGDKKIMIQQGSSTFLAVVLSGTEPPELREVLTDAISRFEGLYAGIIECWDGDQNILNEVSNIVRPIATFHEKFEFEDKEDVRVMSAIEFFQGYVRLKVAVKNNSSTLISDGSLTLTYNKKALFLSHTEPEYPRDGAMVELGNVQPGEKKTVAFYLDPLICMESYIDGTFIYRDYRGELKNVIMKRRPADIVCPLFYTESNINTAMLKRLIDEVKYLDSRVYIIPEGIAPTEIFELSKHVVKRHHVQFVREFIETGPFIGEAWFYGVLEQSQEQMIIRITVRESTDTVEVFVASGNLATLTGLLAELGNGVSDALGVQVPGGKMKVERVKDDRIIQEIGKTSLLINKYAEHDAPFEDK